VFPFTDITACRAERSIAAAVLAATAALGVVLSPIR
jgi:hypothetical protein